MVFSLLNLHICLPCFRILVYLQEDPFICGERFEDSNFLLNLLCCCGRLSLVRRKRYLLAGHALATRKGKPLNFFFSLAPMPVACGELPPWGLILKWGTLCCFRAGLLNGLGCA